MASPWITGPWRAVLVLGVTQIIAWGTICVTPSTSTARQGPVIQGPAMMSRSVGIAAEYPRFAP